MSNPFIQTRPWDDLAWDSVAEFPGIRRVDRQDDVKQGIFHALHKAAPRLTGSNPLVEAAATSDLRAFTVADKFAAARGLLDYLEAVEDQGEEGDPGAAAAAAAKQGEADQQLIRALGYDLSTEGKSEQLRVYKNIRDKRVRKFADMLGRFQVTARTSRRAAPNPAAAGAGDVAQGNDLSRLVDLPQFAAPELEALMWPRWLARTLDVWAPQPKLDRGPVLALVDESGSMSGDPEVWARSLAITIRRFSRGRDFRYIGFATGTRTATDPLEILRGGAPGGGTNFPAAFEAAGKLLQPGADVVFITDGIGGEVPQQILDRIDGKIYAVLVGNDPPELPFADYQVRLTDLTDTNAASDILTGVL